MQALACCKEAAADPSGHALTLILFLALLSKTDPVGLLDASKNLHMCIHYLLFSRRCQFHHGCGWSWLPTRDVLVDIIHLLAIGRIVPHSHLYPSENNYNEENSPWNCAKATACSIHGSFCLSWLSSLEEKPLPTFAFVSTTKKSAKALLEK